MLEILSISPMYIKSFMLKTYGMIPRVSVFTEIDKADCE